MATDSVSFEAPALSNNWGRWGADDQVGALNHLTGDVVRAAAGAVGQGRVISLSLPIKGATSSHAPCTVPHLPGRPLPQHFMSIDGADYLAGAKPPGGLSIADDALVISPHGTSTHMDALCHMWSGKRLYNGHPSSRIRSYGAGRCGIENVPGIVTRGVLFDVAGHRGVDVLDGTDRITAADLDEMERAAGVTIGTGDAVLLRTGWPTLFPAQRDRYWGGEPGLSTDGALWLADRDICAIASDNSAISGLNAQGGADESIDDDIHMICLWRHGIYLMEMLWLEELAAARQPTFLFAVAPLKIVGGTGSAINPLAIL
ncbi:cyclase family protein [Sphingomonas sp. G-3-2-10]|uniref:cyclase family protein n=1 Tax=Sphingomonas sp. G-3-2-10 TaxID=2728838 RepID=UPI00146F0FAD|nr:cyclase family protein [Sphingomonas sp. G-3-2-10]NML08424.1 cyclase family protein [Sphingomonas sp. G-3-2-10]